MTNDLHLPGRRGAPVACDMSTAGDTPDERLAAYDALFARALLGRERRPGAVVFRFRAGARAAVDDLARREGACCPFLDQRVETADGEVVWTASAAATGDDRAAVEAVLDAFHGLPGHAGAGTAGLPGRLAAGGAGPQGPRATR